MDKLPLFNAVLEDMNDGIFAVSLVEYPATEVEWLAFAKEEKARLYFVDDEEQRMLSSVLMLADTPIYRNQGGFEYYIQYKRETLKAMAEKVISDGTLNNIDIEHNGQLLDKGAVQAMELYIKDSEKGINPKGMESVPDGSLMVTYHVNDEAIWDEVRKGTFKGFSLAGIFTIKEAEAYNNKKKETKMSKIEKIKELLQELLVEFSTVRTIDGKEIEVASDTLEEGVAVKAEDGEYILEDGKKLLVRDGVIDGITIVEEVEDETEEESAEEVAEETEKEEAAEEDAKDEIDAALEAIDEEPVEEVVKEEEEEEVVEEPTEEEKKESVDLEQIKADIAALSSQYGTLQGQIDALRDMLAEIASKPAVEPIRDSHEREDFDRYGLKEWRNRK